MILSPLLVYACSFLERPTGHLEYRSDQDLAQEVGIQPLKIPHNGKKLPSQNNNGIPDAPDIVQKRNKKRHCFPLLLMISVVFL